jgi:hypothetical protein
LVWEINAANESHLKKILRRVRQVRAVGRTNWPLCLCASVVVFFLCLMPSAALAAESDFRALFWPVLDKAVPGILAAQDKTSGRWGKGPIVITEQNAIFPLAVAWSQKYAGNKYYHDPTLLKAIMLGGDFLISQQKADGQWVFRTHDGSEWGDIYMPWTYSRWIRAFALVRDAILADERAKWEKGLRIGFGGMAKKGLHGDKHEIENIPTHDAMALYWAGKIFERGDWVKEAVTYLHKAIAAQDQGGFWTENLGPVVNYNFVYMDTLGAYYAMSHDPLVLPALQRGAVFHANFTYPDGRRVETVDERNAYDADIDVPSAGFSFSDVGRGYILQQYALKKAHHQGVGPDLAAAFILYAKDGPIAATSADTDHRFVLGKDDALVVRQKPWFVCLSAYHTPIFDDRWIEDRQNFVSLFHDGTGLIVGGGNAKLTPMWSTFTAGDGNLLSHRVPTTNPSFAEPAGLLHVPTDLKLLPDENSLLATYGSAECKVTVKIENATTADITYGLLNSSELPVEAHVTLIPKLKGDWMWGKEKSGRLGSAALHFVGAKLQAFSHNGWRVEVPAGGSVDWPVLPYDQYVKDGTAPLEQGRIVVTIPLGRTPKESTVRIHVGD